MTSAQDEVVELCSELIRFDTSNPTSSERAAAEWVTGKLDEVGVGPGCTSRSRAGPAWSPGSRAPTGPGRPCCCTATSTSSRPTRRVVGASFSGEERDGFIWGRGAIDMKDMDAMLLSLVRQWARTGEQPPRDVVAAFVADAEAGRVKGARFLVDNHPEEFEGCTEAVSEVGGFSVTLRDGVRMYPIQTAEKGMAWLRLIARGRPGHGSMRHEDNAVTRLAEASPGSAGTSSRSS
jgi:Acetylornithine deacetylase/Succinyl-diaminopimelate desuccinylase and related deacylases